SSARCRAACPQKLPGIEQDEGVGAPGPPQHRQAGGGPPGPISAARRVPRSRPPAFRTIRHRAALRPAPFAPRGLPWQPGLDDGRQGHCALRDAARGGRVRRRLQLWVNLPRTDKMCEPAYQGGVTVRVIAGESLVPSRPCSPAPTLYLDVTVQPGAKEFTQPVPQDWNAFIFVLSAGPSSAAAGPGASSARRTRPCCWTAPARLCGWPRNRGRRCLSLRVDRRPAARRACGAVGPLRHVQQGELLQAKEDYRNWPQRLRAGARLGFFCVVREQAD
uniref:SH3 domain-containing protein n=1 Tax=Macrostomum lignano TaxID=282301 RepID=A0A1I8F3N7_9PLAT